MEQLTTFTRKRAFFKIEHFFSMRCRLSIVIAIAENTLISAAQYYSYNVIIIKYSEGELTVNNDFITEANNYYCI